MSKGCCALFVCFFSLFFMDCNHSQSTFHFKCVPMEIRILFIEHLCKTDIHSFMRSCKLNSCACKQYICYLLSSKFRYLLNHECSIVAIRHLMNIPFVEPMTMNAGEMAKYFEKRTNDSKCIGIDSVTGNGFLSFWMKKICMDDPQSSIITIGFNDSSIQYIYFSDPSDPSYFRNLLMMHPNRDQAANDMEVISEIILNGKVCDKNGGDGSIWCLNKQWDVCMFWPRIRYTFGGDLFVNCKCAFPWQ